MGNHTLAELRDYIWCAADLNIVGAQQVDTIQKPATRARDKYKSGMMYIDGTFYVDKRDKNNIDYSEPIRKWAEDPKREVGPFNVDTMETTRLDSLTLRLGYPYLYVHQGNHEHLMSFVDIRLLSSTDPQKVTGKCCKNIVKLYIFCSLFYFVSQILPLNCYRLSSD